MALCARNVISPAFCGCESILGRKSTNVIFSFPPFMLLSCSFHTDFMLYYVVFISLHVPFILHYVPFILHYLPFMFLSFSFHVPFMFLSFSFHVLSFSVAMYQAYKSLKGDMFKPVRWVSAQPLTFSSYFVIVFVIVLLSFWRPVQVAIFWVHEHVHV